MPNPVAVHRSALDNPRTTFIGLKGGAASVSHGHMDAGSFLLEADGVRWAVDTGMQDYLSLESKGVALWSGGKGGPRWNVFRLGPESHNILRFGGAPPMVDGRGELVRFSALPATAAVKLDAVYADQVAAVSRGALLASYRSVLIRDEWTASARAVSVAGQMLTEADTISVSGNELHLAQRGENLTLRVLAPADAAISVEEMSRPRIPTDAPNPCLKRITLTNRTPASTSGMFHILDMPGTATKAVPNSERPLAEWGAPVPP